MTRNAFRLALAGATMLAGLGTAMIWSAPAMAQAGQAALRGVIRTAPDNPLQDVTLVEVDTGFRRTVVPGADGSYNFPSLRAGAYRLEIRLQKGTRNSDQFTLRVGQNAGLDLDLTTAPAPAQPAPGDNTAGETAPPPAEAQQGDIIVTGSRIRSLSGGQVGINITPRLIEELPQNSRNFLAFADLAPGVRFIESSDGSSRIQGGAQGSNSVNVFIDGVSQKDYVLRGGLTGQDSSPGNPFPQLAIGEYQVLSSNYKAELDQVSSVAIIAGTKSGTNEFHGEGFFDFTNQNLRDRRPTEIYPAKIAKIPSEDKQFGVALGGPIVKDVAHFFVSYEGKRRQVPIDILPTNGVAVSSLPAQYRDIFGSFNSSFRQDLYFGKIDLEPTDKDLVELTGKYRNETGVQIGNGNAAFSTRTLSKVNEKRGMLRWQHSEDSWINDVRVSYEDVAWSPQPAENGIGQQFRTTTRNGSSVSTFDLFRTGAGLGFQDKGQKGWTVQDDFTWTGVENHTFKVGAKAKWVTLNSLEQNLINPLYLYDTTLPSASGFNDQIPYSLQFGANGSLGDPRIRSKNFQLGLYAQDDWDVTDRLTLNLGLRWDYERTPAFLNYVTSAENVNAVSPANYPNLINADYKISDYISTGSNRKAFKGAWQPRVGFTYRLDEQGRFAVFGGYGRSYDRNQFDFLQQELSNGRFQRREFLFQGADTINPCTPGPNCIPWNPIYLTEAGRQQLIGNGSPGGREFRFINNDLKVPYSDQFSLGLRGRFNPVELEVGYTRIVSKDGFVYLLGTRRADGSFFAPSPTTGAPQGPNTSFAPSGYGAIILGDNGLETRADSAYAKLTKAYSAASPWSIDATYTFTAAVDNRPNNDQSSYFLLDFPKASDYPMLRSGVVPRHRFVVAGSVDTPLGVTMSAKFQIESPTFQRALLDTATPYQRTLVGSEVFGLGDRWGRRQLDLAFTKYVPLKFISDATRIRFRVDIINAMNDRNYVDYNNDPSDTTRTPGSPSIYRERSTYSIGGNPPRTVKLSAGFNF
ncbi:TonB-dependent receptor [uncultured Sphingomonas sp.]|uniref:TonB-dependent receptor n=1 Tax=uncultured Sphingomonas sp. TaxID=158754 RepID=UPI0025EA6CCC|nr:TonB-dependent receptor [uncultured Sphingomonas sp.]